MEIREIVQRLSQKAKESRKNFYLIYAIIVGVAITAILTGALLMLSVDSDERGAFFVLIAFGVTAIIVGYIIMFSVTSRKVLNFMTEEIINYYNSINETKLEFEAQPSVNKYFNQSMGLFIRYANPQITYSLDAVNINGTKIKVLNGRLVTSNGKSQTIHFSGFYAIAPIRSDDIFQIRSRGKPHLKGTKFRPLDRYEVKVFVPETDIRDYIDAKYINLYKYITTQIHTKSAYLASNKEEIHLAICPKDRFRVPSVINAETFNDYYRRFIRLIEILVNSFDQLIEL